MIMGHRSHQRRPIPLFYCDPRWNGHIRFPDDARIEGPIMQAIELIERGHLVKREQHIRKSALKAFDSRCQ